MTLIYMFPGQSSRYPGMVRKVSQLHDAAAAALGEACELLGRDLSQHYDSDGAFATNRDIQLGVFVTNHMYLSILQAEGIEADASLGLSLGEWNHLVHIGALSFCDALRAVEQRGLAYDSGPRGAMASVFPLSIAELQGVVERVCREFPHRLEIVNLNSPRQHVIAGEKRALERALEILSDEFYIDGVIIERHIPMHSSMFAPVGRRFREYLAGLEFAKPRIPYLPNRLARFVEGRPSSFVDLLASHVHQPVLWRQSIDRIIEGWSDAVLVEVGAKSVLFNLLDRKWHRRIPKYHLDAKSDQQEHLERTLHELKMQNDGRVIAAGSWFWVQRAIDEIHQLQRSI